MIAGRGISHQGFSTPDTTLLHGVQLWYALPEASRNMPPTFERYAPEAVVTDGTQLRVFIGSLAGSTSPVETHTPPPLAAEALLNAGASLELDLDPAFEYGVLVDTGDLFVNGMSVPVDQLAYLPTGQSTMALEVGENPVRAMVIGGEPLGEQIVMWWNFVGRSHEEVVAYRTAWQAEIDAEPATAPSDGSYPGGATYPRFGPYPEGRPAPLPALALVFGGELTRSTFSELNASEDPAEKDKIMHSMLSTDTGLTLMGADLPNSMEFTPGGYAVSLSGDDEPTLRSYWEQLCDGGEVQEQLAQAPWGDYFGMCTDKFGVNWMVNIAGPGSQ